MLGRLSGTVVTTLPCSGAPVDAYELVNAVAASVDVK